MNKKTAETSHHPAELEVERLRRELGDERIKVEALSRRCIRLGEALDAALKAEEDRTEKDMFSIINGNCYHRKAAAAAEKRRRAIEKKAVAALEKACKRNGISICVSTVICFAAVIFGYAGIIHAALATIIACIALMAIGWLLNTCVYLLGRCE